MSRWYSYLNSAKEILSVYQGKEPFSIFLRSFFSQHKKMGGTDRRWIGHLCYSYFRLGKALKETPVEEKLLAGLFLCSAEPNDILQVFRPAWNEKTAISLEDKFSMLNAQCSNFNVFPWKDDLSDGMDHELFCESFFVQPDLFLRIRPGKHSIVLNKLADAGIDYRMAGSDSVGVSNSTKINEVLDLDKDAVVQDLNSQLVGVSMKSAIRNLKSKILAWDCCAGSGGKSIMLYDIDPEIRLTVSDTRESILINLEKRFKNAGIRNYDSFTIDLTDPKNNPDNYQDSGFDLIIADVPCTGSGTWSRTPEQLYFFEESKIDEYAVLQKKIMTAVIPQLNPGGHLLYITCSVFKKENEEMIKYIQDTFKLELINMELLNGYDKKADTMFAAVLKAST